MSGPWAAKMHHWMHGHAGIIDVNRLIAFGCSRRDAYRLVESGEFEIVMPAVLHSKHWPMGPDQLMIAACLRNPEAVISYLTAAKQWGFRGTLPCDDVHVLVPFGSSPTMPGVVVRRSRRLDPVDIVTRKDGVRMTSPSRTLFDCADVFGVKRATSVLEQLINDGRGTFVTHASTAARLGSRNRPGTRTMRAVIGSRPAWRSAMQSDLEVCVLKEIERQGLPVPETQYGITLANGRRIRYDFAWPLHTAGLEVDHPFWHAGGEASDRDKRRDLKLSTMGWHTMRITDLDVAHGLAESIRDVGIILEQRRPRTAMPAPPPPRRPRN
ncbi:MAG TPA: hypothetical protein VGM78_06720 [Ilumatobacteraceae bacterium]